MIVLGNEQANKMQEMLEEVKDNKQFLVRLGQKGLQYFGDPGAPEDPPTDPVDPPTDPEDPPTDPVDPPADPVKTFTQEDVSKIAAKEAKKAQEALFKKLGVKDFKSAQDALTKYNEMIESQKTEAQKTAEKAQTLEQQNNELTNQVSTLTAQLAGMRLGVNPDSLDDVIVLANKLVNDDVTMDDAIGQVLEKYPHFKVAAVEGDDKKETKKPKFSKGEHKKEDKKSEEETWINAFNWTKTN